MDQKLKDKVAIVTGGTSGIGRGIALAFAQHGARVVVADILERPVSGDKPTHEAILEAGGTAAFYQTDVASLEQVKELIAKTLNEFHQIDILVNNAAAFPTIQSSLLNEDSEWLGVVETNLNGLWFCCKYTLRQMLDQETRGKIINISSRIGLSGAGEGRASYCATKGAVSNLTRQLAVEFGPQGININAICPGFVPNTAQALTHDPERIKVAEQQTPYTRLGTVEDMAAAAVFLASSDSDFINGHNLVVDGGAFVRP